MLYQRCWTTSRPFCEAALSRVLTEATGHHLYGPAIRLIAFEWWRSKFVTIIRAVSATKANTHTYTLSLSLTLSLSVLPSLFILIQLFGILIRIRIHSSHFCLCLRLLHSRFVHTRRIPAALASQYSEETDRRQLNTTGGSHTWHFISSHSLTHHHGNAKHQTSHFSRHPAKQETITHSQPHLNNSIQPCLS